MLRKMQIEGVDYEVNWSAFRKGTSLFFPCLDPSRARTQLMVVVKRLRLKVLIKTTIEDGIRGLRVWRM
jgi:hypothetical protein